MVKSLFVQKRIWKSFPNNVFAVFREYSNCSPIKDQIILKCKVRRIQAARVKLDLRRSVGNFSFTSDKKCTLLLHATRIFCKSEKLRKFGDDGQGLLA